MRSDVSVLYVDPRGPYPKLVTDWWDEKRDARNYAGPNPVVAHPPCGPWGRLRDFCQHQPAWAGPLAVEQVRLWGDVLEHPANSRLFEAAEMPPPGRGPDRFGGLTYPVNQVAWGHGCPKATWLYVVRVRPMAILSTLREGGQPTHWCRKRPGEIVPFGIKMASSQQRRRTPIAFAEWLLDLAAQARRP